MNPRRRQHLRLKRSARAALVRARDRWVITARVLWSKLQADGERVPWRAVLECRDKEQWMRWIWGKRTVERIVNAPHPFFELFKTAGPR